MFGKEMYRNEDFMLNHFKLSPCTRLRSHDWIECPFGHCNEKATRRHPSTYAATMCPDIKEGCPRGKQCHMAHSVFEYWLHPMRYRTSFCKDGNECKRKVCFFAHNLQELRKPVVGPVSSLPVSSLPQHCTAADLGVSTDSSSPAASSSTLTVSNTSCSNLFAAVSVAHLNASTYMAISSHSDVSTSSNKTLVRSPISSTKCHSRSDSANSLVLPTPGACLPHVEGRLGPLQSEANVFPQQQDLQLQPWVTPQQWQCQQAQTTASSDAHMQLAGLTTVPRPGLDDMRLLPHWDVPNVSSLQLAGVVASLPLQGQPYSCLGLQEPQTWATAASGTSALSIPVTQILQQQQQAPCNLQPVAACFQHEKVQPLSQKNDLAGAVTIEAQITAGFTALGLLDGLQLPNTACKVSSSSTNCAQVPMGMTAYEALGSHHPSSLPQGLHMPVWWQQQQQHHDYLDACGGQSAPTPPAADLNSTAATAVTVISPTGLPTQMLAAATTGMQPFNGAVMQLQLQHHQLLPALSCTAVPQQQQQKLPCSGMALLPAGAVDLLSQLTSETMPPQLPASLASSLQPGLNFLAHQQ